MTDINNSILALDPNAKVTVNAEDITQITWHDNNPNAITNAAILAKQIKLQAAYNAKKYKRSRATEYPKIADQLDDLYHNGIDGWKTTIKAIKDKHPKE